MNTNVFRLFKINNTSPDISSPLNTHERSSGESLQSDQHFPRTDITKEGRLENLALTSIADEQPMSARRLQSLDRFAIAAEKAFPAYSLIVHLSIFSFLQFIFIAVPLISTWNTDSAVTYLVFSSLLVILPLLFFNPSSVNSLQSALSTSFLLVSVLVLEHGCCMESPSSITLLYAFLIVVWSAFLIGIPAGQCLKRIICRIWDHIRVLLILQLKCEQEAILAGTIISAHYPEDVMEDLLVDFAKGNRPHSRSYNEVELSRDKIHHEMHNKADRDRDHFYLNAKRDEKNDYGDNDDDGGDPMEEKARNDDNAVNVNVNAKEIQSSSWRNYVDGDGAADNGLRRKDASLHRRRNNREQPSAQKPYVRPLSSQRKYASPPKRSLVSIPIKPDSTITIPIPTESVSAPPIQSLLPANVTVTIPKDHVPVPLTDGEAVPPTTAMSPINDTVTPLPPCPRPAPSSTFSRSHSAADEISQNYDRIIESATESSILSKFKSPLISPDVIDKLSGVSSRYCTVLAIKLDIGENSECTLTNIGGHAVHDLLDVAAKEHRVACIRKFGDTWVGCVGYFKKKAWNDVPRDAYHAMAMAVETMRMAQKFRWRMCCAISSGKIMGGFFNDCMSFDLIGPEVRWVLDMSDTNRTGEIFLTSVTHRHLERCGEDAITNKEISFMTIPPPPGVSAIPGSVYSICNDRCSSFRVPETILSEFNKSSKRVDNEKAWKCIHMMARDANDDEPAPSPNPQSTSSSVPNIHQIINDKFIRKQKPKTLPPRVVSMGGLGDEFYNTAQQRFGVDLDDSVYDDLTDDVLNKKLSAIYSSIQGLVSKHCFDTTWRLLLLVPRHFVLQSKADNPREDENNLILPVEAKNTVISSEVGIGTMVWDSFMDALTELAGYCQYRSESRIHAAPDDNIMRNNNNLSTDSQRQNGDGQSLDSFSFLRSFAMSRMVHPWSNMLGSRNVQSDNIDIGLSTSELLQPLPSLPIPIPIPTEKDEKLSRMRGWFKYNKDMRTLSHNATLFSIRGLLLLFYPFQLGNCSSDGRGDLMEGLINKATFTGFYTTQKFTFFLLLNIITELFHEEVFRLVLGISLLGFLYEIRVNMNNSTVYNDSLCIEARRTISALIWLLFCNIIATFWTFQYLTSLAYVTEHILCPVAVETFKQQRKLTMDLLKRIRSCVVLAIHIKAADLLPGLVHTSNSAEFLKQLHNAFDASVEQCGFRRITQFSVGLIIAVSCKETSLENAYPGSITQTHTGRAVTVLRVIQEKLDEFNRSNNVSVTVGVGLNLGSVSIGFLGNSRYCFDISGAARNVACLMALSQSNGIIAASVLHKEIKAMIVSEDAERIVSIPSRDISSSTRWLKVILNGGVSSGLQLDDFEHICLLGKGGYGSVHLVREIASSTQYAVKVIPRTGTEHAKMLQRELDILQKMKHRNVVNFKYCLLHKTRTYLVMSYIRGGSLSQIMKGTHKPELSVLTLWFAELVLALEYVHGLGIIHRDVKPANCMIGADGHLKLTDFGLSKAISYSEKLCGRDVHVKSDRSPNKSTIGDNNNNNNDNDIRHPNITKGSQKSRENDSIKIMQKVFPLLADNAIRLLVIDLDRNSPQDKSISIIIEKMYCFKVITADSGEAAIDRYVSKGLPVDMILVDVSSASVMCRQEGYETIKQIMGHSQASLTPVVAICDSEHESNIKDLCLAAGAKEVVSKPLSEQRDLLLELGHSFRKQRQEASQDPTGESVSDQNRTSFTVEHVKATTTRPDGDIRSTVDSASSSSSSADLEDMKRDSAVPVAVNKPNLDDITGVVGTLHFIAPEVFEEKKYTPAVDWWASGALFYECTIQSRLFIGSDDKEIIGRIRNGHIDLSAIECKSLKSLVTGLLNRSYLKRLGSKGAHEIKQHPFFDGVDWDTINESDPQFKPPQKLSDDRMRYENVQLARSLFYCLTDDDKSMRLSSPFRRGGRRKSSTKSRHNKKRLAPASIFSNIDSSTSWSVRNPIPEGEYEEEEEKSEEGKSEEKFRFWYRNYSHRRPLNLQLELGSPDSNFFSLTTATYSYAIAEGAEELTLGRGVVCICWLEVLRLRRRIYLVGVGSWTCFLMRLFIVHILSFGMLLLSDVNLFADNCVERGSLYGDSNFDKNSCSLYTNNPYFVERIHSTLEHIRLM
eukprot:gene3802-7567_t